MADGLAATARVITAAALIMVCVFSAFVLGDDRQLKLFGLGMAFAVFIDATIVRAHQHSAGARKKTAGKRSADPAAD